MVGQDGCKRRIEVSVKIKKKYIEGGGVESGDRVRGQGRCEQRSKVFVKIQKKKNQGQVGEVGWGGGGVRVDVNGELKFL